MSSASCPEQADDAVWIRELADGLIGRGLSTPAIVLLEMCRPVAFIGSQLLLLLHPLLIPFTGAADQRYARLLEDPQHLDRLLEMLEHQR